MAFDNVILGSAPNDGKGDTVRNAFAKVNGNFAQAEQRISSAESAASALTASKGKANGVVPLNAQTQIEETYLKNSGATAGTYGTAVAVGAFTIDAKGRITSASTTAIRAATTAATGIVQLNDTMTSTSVAQAATANAVKKTYDYAKTMIPLAQRGAANGVATLGADGKVPLTQLELPKGGQYIGDQAVKAIAFNAKAITENVTIPGDVNALSAGPIEIGDGFTVTINDGATWTVV